MDSRIGELRLRIRTDLSAPERVRPAAERFVRRVLERCVELLEESAPARIVLMRRLPLRLRLDEPSLGDAAHVEDLARTMVERIERAAPPSPPDFPSAAEEAVFFDDEAHLRASHLLSLARGGPAWFHAELDVFDSRGGALDPLAALAAPEKLQFAWAALVRLARAGVLAEALAARPESAAAALGRSLGITSDSGASRSAPSGASDGDWISPAQVAAVESLAALSASWPWLSIPARALAFHAHAASMSGAAETEARVIARAAMREADRAAPGSGFGEASGGPQSDREAVRSPALVRDLESGISSTDAERSPAAPRRADAASDGGSERQTRRQDPSPEGGARIRPDGDVAKEPAEAGESAFASVLVTRCAGLFFLFDRIQELGLGEALWKACLPEGAVLTSAARALLGPDFEGDPAPALLGGKSLDVACPPVLPEQHEEVALSVLAELVSAFPRRGLAALPPVVLSRTGTGDGGSGPDKLLVATAEDSPFALFAWPAPTPSALVRGLRAFLQIWPHEAPVFSAPALAELDDSRRVRPRRAAAAGSVLLPTGPSSEASALLGLVIGAPCQLFASRAGAPPPRAARDFVARQFTLGARVEMGHESMRVVLRAEDADTDVRRAGLDRDPGWVPWLSRSVRFHFEEADGDSAAGPVG
jgi:hypothetical protein